MFDISTFWFVVEILSMLLNIQHWTTLQNPFVSPLCSHCCTLYKNKNIFVYGKKWNSNLNYDLLVAFWLSHLLGINEQNGNEYYWITWATISFKICGIEFLEQSKSVKWKDVVCRFMLRHNVCIQSTKLIR